MDISRIFRYVVVFTVIMSGGCMEDGAYEGDGAATYLESPSLGKSGYLIELPIIHIHDQPLSEFTINRFPQIGNYIVYLALGDDVLEKLDFVIEIYKEGIIQKRLDSTKQKLWKESTKNFEGYYFMSSDPDHSGVLEVKNFDDNWRIKIMFANTENLNKKITANLLLRIGGYK